MHGVFDWAKEKDAAGKYTGKLNPAGKAVISGVGGVLVNALGLNDVDERVIGYQGQIPEYEALRSRVGGIKDLTRSRPGSGGRRYFSDIRYVDNPTDKAAAEAEIAQQIIDLEEVNKDNPYSYPETWIGDKTYNPMQASNTLPSVNWGGGYYEDVWDSLPEDINNWSGADLWLAYDLLKDANPLIRRDIANKFGISPEEVNSWVSSVSDMERPGEYPVFQPSTYNPMQDFMDILMANIDGLDFGGTSGGGTGGSGSPYKNLFSDFTADGQYTPQEIMQGMNILREHGATAYQDASTWFDRNVEGIGADARTFTSDPSLMFYGDLDDWTEQDIWNAYDILNTADDATKQQFSDRYNVPVDDINTYLGGMDTSTRPTDSYVYTPYGMRHGGIVSLDNGGYLHGGSDGMGDQIPANIDGVQNAALSHGEFVVPADVVSHLGNGNSQSGAEILYGMMDRVRHARTGSNEQSPQISPHQYLPI